MNYHSGDNVLGEPEFVKLPGSGSKFFIRYDEVNNSYIMISNPLSDCGGNRHILSLYQSPDFLYSLFQKKLRNEIKIDIMFSSNPKNYGFQYPSFILDKSRILIVVRVAENQESYHDANKIILLIVERSSTELGELKGLKYP